MSDPLTTTGRAAVREHADTDTLPLVPRSLSEILTATFVLYRRRGKLFLSITACLCLPLTVLQALSRAVAGDSMETRAMLVGGLSLLGLPVLLLAQGALIRAVSQAYLGRPCSLTECLQFAAARFLPLLRALVAVCCLGLLPGLGVGFGAAVVNQSTALGGLLMAACLVVVVLLALWSSFLTQAVILEGRAGLDAFRRSRQLAQGNLLSLLGLGVCLSLLSLPLYLPVVAAGPLRFEQFGHGALLELYHGAVEVCWLPVTLGSQILLYYDIRIRRERFDRDELGRSMIVFGD